MKNTARILAVVFGVILLGAIVFNTTLISRNRSALAKGVLRDPATVHGARSHLIVAIPDTDDSYFRGLLDGIEEAAKPAEAAIQVLRFSTSSGSEAERCFDIAMKARVDGLIMFTTRNDPIKSRSEKASKAGVAFIPVCTEVPASNDIFFIGIDPLRHGFESAAIVLSRLGSSARIGVILPSAGSENPKDEPFYRGIDSATKVYPGARIETVIRARPGALSGEESAATMLGRSSKVNAIICSSARDTIGAAQVIIDMNAVGKVLIVGTDETSEIRRYIDNGVVTASIIRDSKAIGQAAVRAFERMRDGLQAGEPVESGFSIYQSEEKAK